MNYLTSILCGLVFTLSLVQRASAEVVTFVADEWYPYNGNPKGDLQGFMVDIARYSLAKEGHDVSYRLQSWDRSLDSVTKGTESCLLGAYKSEAPGLLFPDEHQGVDQTTFYAHSEGAGWRYKGVESLEGIRLGVIDGYEYTDEIDAYVGKHRGTSKVHVAIGRYALLSNIKLLVNGQLDAIVDSFTVIEANAAKQGWSKKIEPAGTADALSKVYIACSPAQEKSPQYIKLISQGVRELRKTGELQQILDRYGLEDWSALDAVDN